MLTLEKLLNGRSILDLTGKEAAFAEGLLLEALENKRFEDLSDIEYNALIEKLIKILALNTFKGNVPYTWKQELLNRLENSPQRKWGWEWASVLDVYLSGVELWDMIDPEDKTQVAKDIIDYLRGEYETFI